MRLRCFCLAILVLASVLEPQTVLRVGGKPKSAGYYLAAEPAARSTVVSPIWSKDLLAELGVAALGRDGGGVKIALIDTGADARIIPRANIINWIDLTSEGVVPMSAPLEVSLSDTVAYGGRVYNVSGVKSESGYVRIGLFKPKESIPDSAPCREFIRPLVEVPVLIADNYVPKQYDTVYIDSDLDGSFGDEVGLEVYRNSRASVGVRGLRGLQGTFSLVVSDIRDNGSLVVLGFDGHGHGTSVASIITGHEQSIEGIAPGVQLIVIKAVESSGTSTWNRLANAIDVACAEGAKVIILAVAPSASNANTSGICAALERTGRDYGAVVVMPAGNEGPGIGTLPTYADLDNVVIAGGYIPTTVSKYLHWNSGGRLWPWSSMGPTANGSPVTVIAPAVAPALLPLWASSPDQPHLFEGTSCSAAYVGGVTALLVEQHVKAGKTPSPALIRRALMEGAQPLMGIEPVEQGSGLVNASNSIEALERIQEKARIRSVSKWGTTFLVNGFFSRDQIPGYVPVSIDNFSPFSTRLRLEAPAWLNVHTKELGIPAVEQRTILVSTDPALSPGLHSGWIKGDDPGIPGQELKSLWTVLVPRDLGEEGHFGIQQLLWPGDVHREYVRVPEGLEYLVVSAEVTPGIDLGPRGRIKVYVYGNKGQPLYESPWIGRGAEQRSAEVKFKIPSTGVWEVDVVSDPASSLFGAEEAAFKLDISYEGLIAREMHTSLWVSDTESNTQSGRVVINNTGESFKYEPLVIASGENGDFIVEDLALSGSAALMKPLPPIAQGTKRVFIAASNPKDSGASLSVFLYYFDKGSNRWVQVASAKGTAMEDAEISLVNPKPGQYIAYVEGSRLSGPETSFRWIAVIAREQQSFSVTDQTPGDKTTAWEQNATKVLTFSPPGSLAKDGEPKKVFLTIWDSDSGKLKSAIPIHVHKDSPMPFAYVGKGAVFDGKMAVTIRAWDPRTFKPIDALVRLDDVWYQLYKGEATVILDKTSLDGTVLLAEYPGMSPSMKVLADMP
ncbi:MAG: S8 family serine peptidase [Candidatus Fermentithermobacillus carboniphilus]|uniref:S8 family serine peptidase n=1 Tax=Candidatus Fermentithermobacillus carboniphilus TaxID=3085328 RepID=A0AAT9LA19_9FIRM|nr:MAG: S8 family serine peptidase [Candidatus Fermentithermobacillus carboniphilus]